MWRGGCGSVGAQDYIFVGPGGTACSTATHALRKVVRLVNRVLEDLKVEKHPDKTFIGRVERGFDFLGYHFEIGELGVAQITLERFRQRIIQLYERNPHWIVCCPMGTLAGKWAWEVCL